MKKKDTMLTKIGEKEQTIKEREKSNRNVFFIHQGKKDMKEKWKGKKRRED